MQNQSSPQKQNKITYELRKQLIRLVKQQKKTIKQAHHILKINYSTAKMIMRKFKDHGRITKFKRETHPKDQIPTCLDHQSTSELKQPQSPKTCSQNSTPQYCQSLLQTIQYFDYIPTIVSPNFYYPGQECAFTGMEIWNTMGTTNLGFLCNNMCSFYF